MQAAAGTSVAYSVSVMNNDFGACDSDTFALDSLVPSGWGAAFSASAVQIAPGSAAAAGMTLASAKTSNGTYRFQVKANRSTVSNFTEDSIVILGGLDASLSALTDANFAQLAATIHLGGAPVSGATVTFTVVNPQGKKTTLSATTDAQGIARTKLRMKFKDAQGLYQVTASVSYSGLSATASGEFLR